MNALKYCTYQISAVQMKEIAEYIADERPVSLKNSDGVSAAAH